MTALALLTVGYLAGAVSAFLAVLVGQRMRDIRRQEDAAHEQATAFMAWADRNEFDEERRLYQRRVRDNRAASGAVHQLQILRREHDRKHGGNWE